jgi:hypothetical protein
VKAASKGAKLEFIVQINSTWYFTLQGGHDKQSILFLFLIAFFRDSIKNFYRLVYQRRNVFLKLGYELFDFMGRPAFRQQQSIGFMSQTVGKSHKRGRAGPFIAPFNRPQVGDGNSSFFSQFSLGKAGMNPVQPYIMCIKRKS